MVKESALPADKEWVRRKRPGRPEGVGDNAAEYILDAAEEVFSQMGYHGATMRMVAQRAAVTQALISYYFGSKHGLYEAVFLRRSRSISESRVQGLNAIMAGPGPVEVKDIVRAFLVPTLALRATEGGRRFLRLQARLHTEPADISYTLRNKAYDVSTKAFIEALAQTCPHLPAKDVNWRMILMIGSYMYAFSDTHRLEQLAPDVCDPHDIEEISEQITAFVTAGLLAPAVSG